jgi:hypothetical protein
MAQTTVRDPEKRLTTSPSPSPKGIAKQGPGGALVTGIVAYGMYPASLLPLVRQVDHPPLGERTADV